MRVLVVDDERDALEIMRRLLAEHGCEVTTASTAEEALARLAERPFDVLLSDIGMPGVDGYELLRRVRTGPAPHPRAIAVTAFARAEDRERALAVGFDGHLEKPLTPARLMRSLAALRRMS
jgi:CheY-like chemotaxis protein